MLHPLQRTDTHVVSNKRIEKTDSVSLGGGLSFLRPWRGARGFSRPRERVAPVGSPSLILVLSPCLPQSVPLVTRCRLLHHTSFLLRHLLCLSPGTTALSSSPSTPSSSTTPRRGWGHRGRIWPRVLRRGRIRPWWDATEVAWND